VLHTSQGDITLELYPDKAPKSVANFLQYVRDGFYDGTVLHRAIPGYLVQGGLYTRDLQPKRTRPAIASEADNGLSNLRGTVAVARGAIRAPAPRSSSSTWSTTVDWTSSATRAA
jgi:peptidyl-prolyl cis-trans isomerase A (cyclophilin A)